MLIHQKDVSVIPVVLQATDIMGRRRSLTSEAEVMCWTPEEFKTYLTTKAFHDDHAEYCGTRSAIPLRSSNGSGNQGGSILTPSAPGVANGTGALAAQELCRNLKRDIAHYPDLK
jgi:hypothetical protein